MFDSVHRLPVWRHNHRRMTEWLDQASPVTRRRLESQKKKTTTTQWRVGNLQSRRREDGQRNQTKNNRLILQLKQKKFYIITIWKMAPSHQTETERRCSHSNPMPSTTASTVTVTTTTTTEAGVESRNCHRRPMSRSLLASLLPLCYLMAVMSCWTSVLAGWQDDIQPRRSITLGKLTPPYYQFF